MIILGAQYYRPPTPGAERWAEDFKRMKDTGMNTVQLWAVWGWIEPEPTQYVFDDYDRLMDLAAENGLKVVISTIADVQPFWMPRIHPEALMIDERGQIAMGTPRAECLSGITPGCCTDHTQVRERTMAFMSELAAHYHKHPALLAWDCWNETRWCVHCEKWVCYCEASLAAFRKYLHQQYKDLPTLSEAWGRRLVSWDDVYPAHISGFINPALIDFQRWLIMRARDTAAWRYDALRAGDPDHFISAHSAGPITDTKWRGEEAPFARGDDFDNAGEVDGFGSSAFPAWFGSDPADYGTRMEVARSVSAPKPFWNSELQGGAYNQGFTYGPAVSGSLQQCWTWSAIARGAKGIIYWCWRDEVWGVESGGYGIIGQDGMTEDRIKHLQQTGTLLKQFETLLDDYHPDPAKVGLIYNSNDVILASTNREHDSKAASLSINGVMRILEQERIPFDILNGRNLSIPKDIRLLVLPACFTLDQQAAQILQRFLEQGGWVFSEAGTGMFTDKGFFYDRADERPLVGALGINQIRRQTGDVNIPCTIPANTYGSHDTLTLKSAIWSISMDVPEHQVVAVNDNQEAILADMVVGKGRFIMSGSFPAHAFEKEPYPDFKTFLVCLAQTAEATPDWRISSESHLDNLFIRTGLSDQTRLFFIINMGEERHLRIHPAEKNIKSAEEWVDGHHIEADDKGWLTVTIPAQSHRILSWPQKGSK